MNLRIPAISVLAAAALVALAPARAHGTDTLTPGAEADNPANSGMFKLDTGSNLAGADGSSSNGKIEWIDGKPYQWPPDGQMGPPAPMKTPPDMEFYEAPPGFEHSSIPRSMIEKLPNEPIMGVGASYRELAATGQIKVVTDTEGNPVGFTAHKGIGMSLMLPPGFDETAFKQAMADDKAAKEAARLAKEGTPKPPGQQAEEALAKLRGEAAGFNASNSIGDGQGGLPTCGVNPTTYCVPPKNEKNAPPDVAKMSIPDIVAKAKRDAKNDAEDGVNDTGPQVAMGPSPNNTGTGGNALKGKGFQCRTEECWNAQAEALKEFHSGNLNAPLPTGSNPEYKNVAQTYRAVNAELASGDGIRRGSPGNGSVIAKARAMLGAFHSALLEGAGDPNGFLTDGAGAHGQAVDGNQVGRDLVPIEKCRGFFGTVVMGNRGCDKSPG